MAPLAHDPMRRHRVAQICRDAWRLATAGFPTGDPMSAHVERGARREDHDESSPKDASYVIRVALDGIGRGTDPSDLRAELALLLPNHDVFPAEVLLELAADAIDESDASRLAPIEFETLRDHYLPASDAHTRAQHYKSLYALRAAAMIRAGVDPGLLDEISHWRNDDLWAWSLDALLVYLRVAAQRTDLPLPAVCKRVAARHGITLTR